MIGDWACEAYGPEIADIGAVCFRSGELGKRVCADLDDCHRSMRGQRQQVFRRINELAARGNEVAEYLAGEFTRPEQLLGGGQDDGEG